MKTNFAASDATITDSKQSPADVATVVGHAR